MTQARTRAHGLVTPSLPQQWLGAMLRAFVELVSSVASTLRMSFILLPRDWHTDVEPEALPEEKTDIQQQEKIWDRRAPARQSTRSVEHDDQMIIVNEATLSVSFSALCRESRLAQHRDSQLIVPRPTLRVEPQAKAGTQSLNGTRASIPDQRTPPWIPAFAGMSGHNRMRKTAPL